MEAGTNAGIVEAQAAAVNLLGLDETKAVGWVRVLRQVNLGGGGLRGARIRRFCQRLYDDQQEADMILQILQWSFSLAYMVLLALIYFAKSRERALQWMSISILVALVWLGIETFRGSASSGVFQFIMMGFVGWLALETSRSSKHGGDKPSPNKTRKPEWPLLTGELATLPLTGIADETVSLTAPLEPAIVEGRGRILMGVAATRLIHTRRQ